MSCARTRQMLDAWIDHELDPDTRAELAGHFDQCPGCAALRAERERVRETIRRAAPRYRAPLPVISAVHLALARESSAPARMARHPTWLQTWALAGVAAAFGALLMFAVLRAHAPVPEAQREMAVASHVAALAAAQGRQDGLVQVASSDRHMVKPWFQGKVDFAPVVRNLSADGYALLGARLDRIGDRQAAAIVYRVRNHPIDLFVWRTDADQTAELEVSAHRGFGVATWAAQGLGFAVVSDVDPRDLERFARLVRGQQ